MDKNDAANNVKSKLRERPKLKEYNFKPGVSGNPSGRPKLPPEVKKARAMNKNEVAVLLTRYMHMTKTELQEVVRNPDTSVMEGIVSSIIAVALKTGDHTRLNFIFDRIIGKVKDEIDVTVSRLTVVEYENKQIHMGVNLPADEKEEG